MPHFTLQFTGDGPLVTAFVGVSEPRGAALQAIGTPLPDLIKIRALIDTGASCSCIDPDVLAKLGLTPTGSVPMITPSTGATPHSADQYDVGLLIPGGEANQLPLVFSTIPVLASSLTGQGFNGLIGRDILSNCILNYNGTMGLFTLAY